MTILKGPLPCLQKFYLRNTYAIEMLDEWRQSFGDSGFQFNGESRLMVSQFWPADTWLFPNGDQENVEVVEQHFKPLE